MNRPLLLASGLLLTGAMVSAQSVSDCAGAIQLCGDTYSETSVSLNTGDVYEPTGECNQGFETASMWYTFTVQSDGLLSFILTPNVLEDDYDWGLFEVTYEGCEGILDGTSLEVGCNSYGQFGVNGSTGVSSAQGGTGNTNGPGDLNGPPFNADISVFEGQTFALVVMNWTNSLDGYTIDFGESTASLYDEVPPAITAVEVDCSLTDFVVEFDEPILVSSVEAADLRWVDPAFNAYPVGTISPANAGAQLETVFEFTLASPIPSTGMYALEVTDVAGSVEDPCGNLGIGAFERMLTFIDEPVGFDVVEVVVCPDESTVLLPGSVAAQPTSTTFDYSWSWLPADASDPLTLEESESQVTEGDGLYTVMITSDPTCYQAFGAFDVVTEECGIYIPNVFSPGNGDFHNPAFRVEGLDAYPGSSVRIFNRWGNLVYKNDRFDQSAGWAPIAAAASEGTYYYELRVERGSKMLQVEDFSGVQVHDGQGPVVLSGSLSLVR